MHTISFVFLKLTLDISKKGNSKQGQEISNPVPSIEKRITFIHNLFHKLVIEKKLILLQSAFTSLKSTRETPLVSLLLALNRFLILFRVSSVDSEQVNTGRDTATLTQHF